MTDSHSDPRCLVCDRTQDLTPLIPLQYRAESTWICPQHLPILIQDKHASPRHADLSCEEGKLRLRNLGSASRMLVNGKQVNYGTTDLKPNDEIRIGAHVLTIVTG